MTHMAMSFRGNHPLSWAISPVLTPEGAQKRLSLLESKEATAPLAWKAANIKAM